MRTMNRLLVAFPLIACASCGEGAQGPQGDPGPQGTMGEKGDPGATALQPTLIGILPTSAMAERPVLLQLSGAGTHFGKDTHVTFDDPAITVGQITVGSAGYLQAAVTLGVGVRLGSHDLSVDSSAVDPSGQPTGGRETVALKGVFTVAGSLAAEATGNTKMVQQGGLVDFSVRNLDRDNPFAGLGRVDGGLRSLSVSAAGSKMTGYGLVDALAAVGPLPLHATFDSMGQRLGYVLDPVASGANAPQVTARPATVLTAGMAQLGEKLATLRGTNLYKLTTTEDSQVVVWSFATAGGLVSTTLAGAVAPTSGRFADGQFFYASLNGAAQTALSLQPTKGDSYAAVMTANLTSGADYGYSLTARTATAKQVSAKENTMMSDGPAAPLLDLLLDAPRYATDGALDGPVDADYIRIKVAKSGRLYVQAVTPGQGLSPSTVSVALTAADCTSSLAPQRPVQQEANVSMDTTYCAVLSSPTSYIGPYQLIIAQDL